MSEQLPGILTVSEHRKLITSRKLTPSCNRTEHASDHVFCAYCMAFHPSRLCLLLLAAAAASVGASSGEQVMS
jgi:hypothetical protein